MAVLTRANPSVLGASQYPTQSGRFIPELWSGKLQVKFYKNTFLTEIANTDYEGEIRKYGDQVQIRTVPTITIRDYEVGLVLTNEVPTADNILLEINKAKYFSFLVDDVEAMQADIALMNTFSDDASEQLKIAIETAVLPALYADVSADNKGDTAGLISNNINLGKTGAAVALASTNILSTIVDLGQVLDEQNVPEVGRFLLLPPWAISRLKKSDLKDASITGDGTSVLRNGRVGMIDRFTVYASNNVPSVTDGGDTVFYIYAGTKHALTFASQMTKMETLRSQDTFGQIVRGLQVFGFELVKPEAITALYAKAA